MTSPLVELSVQSARDALKRGEPTAALERLDQVSARERPADLVAACYSSLSRSLAADGLWSKSTAAVAEANRAVPSPYRARRLALLRSRQSLIGDSFWDAMSSAIERPRRLKRHGYAPDVSAVFACGSYHAWGSGPWTDFLRLSKSQGPVAAEDRAAALNLARGYFARALLSESELVGLAALLDHLRSSRDAFESQVPHSGRLP